MSHETPTINAVPRDRIGSRFAKRLRNSGRLPAIIYGHKIDPLAVSVDEKEVLTHLHRGSHVFNVIVEGAETETCLVKELQFGFLGDNVIHVDFARVELDEEVEVAVRLNFVGVPKLGQKPGAVVSHPISDMDVICKVNAIPSEIRVDTAQMEDTVMTIGDIQMPPGVRTELDPDTPIVTISFIAEEEAEGEAAEVVGAETAEPEVITEAKAEEKEAEKD